jgi:hypothetical protein
VARKIGDFSTACKSLICGQEAEHAKPRFAASQSKIVKASYTPQNLRFWGVKIETYKSLICAPKPTVLRDLDSIHGIKNFFIKNF